MVQITEQFGRNFDMGQLPASGYEGNAPTQAGGRPIPFFFRQGVYLAEQSAKLGRPVYKQIEMIKIVIPGDSHSAPVRRVNQSHKDRFPEHYAAFQREEEIAETGTPIDHWGILTNERRFALKHLNIFTVEQVAALSDEQLQKVGMGSTVLREQARAFVEAQKNGAVPERLVSENKALHDQVAMLTKRIEAMSQQMQEIAAKGKVDMTNVADPVMAAKADIANTARTSSGHFVDIPENYKSLGLRNLREIADQISAAPVLNKDDAIKVIEDYLGRKAAAASA